MTNSEGPEYIRQQTSVDPGLNVIPPPPAVQQVAPVLTQEPVLTQQPVVTQQPVLTQQPVVAQQMVEPAAAVRTSYSRRFAPDAMIAALVGVVLLIVGLLAMIRGGFDGTMEEPIVDVLGFTHTTTLGIVQAVIGALLLICGASSLRSGAIFFGTVLAIGGFIAAVQTESFDESLAIESTHAWIAVGAGVVVVASALLMPRYVSRSTTVQAT